MAESATFRMSCLPVLLCAAMTGCGGDSDALEQKLVEKDAVVAELHQQLSGLESGHRQALIDQTARLQQEHTRAVERLEAEWQAQAEEQRVATAGLQRQLTEQNRLIQSLTQSLAEATAGSVPVGSEPAVAASPAADTPVSLPVVARSSPRSPDLFPLRVFDVRGERVVTGVHRSVRYVETEETYKNGRGETQHVRAPETYEVNQYGYQVSFSVENLLEAPLSFDARAGEMTDTFSVAGGTTASNFAVRAARGAPLVVSAGGRRWDTRIRYDESAP